MSEHVANLAQTFGPRYSIESPIGRGGAADVYLALDRLRGRHVALKVLREELALSATAERFMAEIRVSAQLPHPGIVPVCEFGEVDGVPYYVMPFIDGEALRARLWRSTRIPLAEALPIVEDIARALDFAHRRSVVHRDIKPGNVMLRQGRAMLLDFGIALALDIGMPRRTSPGMTLGTVEYMSPEQVSGELRLDGRSDIYSLACVMYEMLAGRPPFMGTPTAVINRHLSAEPRALAIIRPEIPAAVSRVISQALAKSPDERFSTAGEFVEALRRACLSPAYAEPQVAVPCFVDLRPAPAVDGFSDRMTEEVIFALRKLGGFRVATRSTLPPGGPSVHVSTIGRHLEADALLFGTVRDLGECVRLAATLLDAKTGAHLWSGSLTGPLRGGFDLEWQPADRLARGIGATVNAVYGAVPGRDDAGPLEGRDRALTLHSQPAPTRQRHLDSEGGRLALACTRRHDGAVIDSR